MPRSRRLLEEYGLGATCSLGLTLDADISSADEVVRVDYQGVITFESFSSAVVKPGLSNTLAIWRNLWTDGMDLACRARVFVTDGMEAARQRAAVGQTTH